MKWNRTVFLSARGSVLVGLAWSSVASTPSDLDPSGFDPGGFDPSGFDPSGFEKNSSTVVQSYSRAGLAQWPPIYPKSAPSWVQHELNLDPTWAHLGPTLAQVGPSCAQAFGTQRASRLQRRSGPALGASWGPPDPPGALLVALGRLLGRSGRLLGGSWGAPGGPESCFC